MEGFVKQLQVQLHLEVSEVNINTSPVKGYDKKAELVESAIINLKNYLAKHPFPNKSTEIKYFKYWSPALFKLQIYFASLYNLERTRITATDDEEFLAYLKKKKNRIDRFLKKWRDLRLYLRLGQQDKDEQLFTSSPPSKKKQFLTVDHYYCKSSISLSKIIAYEEYLPILTEELNAAKERNKIKKLTSGQNNTITKKYGWKPTKTQTEELIYSFVNLKCISVYGHDADIKEIVTLFKDVFDLDIENIYDIHHSNKKRKKEKSPYLNALRDAYLNSG